MKRQPEQRSRTRQSLDRDLEFDNPKQYRQTLDIRLDLATMDRDQNLATLDRAFHDRVTLDRRQGLGDHGQRSESGNHRPLYCPPRMAA